MRIETTEIPGCLLCHFEPFKDGRGSFIKIFQETVADQWSHFRIRELFFSVSHKDVVRGIHFQSPPFAHDKLVFCVAGRAFDVVVDLRKDSPTFRKALSFHLGPNDTTAIFIPKGLAHGFCALQDETAVCYAVDSEHSKTHDHGILWNSIDLQWPVKNPVISQRDLSFPTLSEFVSPF